jgi:hypothetical protein
MLRHYGISEHDGWKGIFTTRQSPMATINNGARVELIASDDDAHPPGMRGTVLGSVGTPKLGVAYFVEFDAKPREAELIVEGKIAAIAAG